MQSRSDYVVRRSPADHIINGLVRLQRVPILGVIVRMCLLLRGTDIHPQALTQGTRLVLPHAGTGVVVHQQVSLAGRVTLFHGATIGRADIWRPHTNDSRCEVGHDVILGAHATVLFGRGVLSIGDGTVLGANSVLLESTRNNEIWAGNPARKVGDRAE